MNINEIGITLNSNGIILLIIIVVIFILWIQWIIGKAIGKRVSHTTGLILGIVLIIVGLSLLMGIACIIYSQQSANAVHVINANVNVNNQQQYANQQSSLDDTMECPYCAETIKNNAKICRYCNNKLV